MTVAGRGRRRYPTGRVAAHTAIAVVAAVAAYLLLLPGAGVARTGASLRPWATVSSTSSPGVAARRRHRRPGCGTFCQQAGPAAGGGDLPPLLLRAVRTSRLPIHVVGGVAPVRVSCRFTHAMEPLLVGATVAKGCVGALFLVDGNVVDRHGGRLRSLRDLVVGSVNLVVPSGRSETIDVPLTRTERNDLRRLHRLRVELEVELKGRVYYDDPDHPGQRVLGTDTHQHVWAVTITLLG
ncbi:MAG: hypothetical protein QOH11_500 [Solirubrobacteraceae bacterium]|jgi:hypothetical protein|nr:hypothetical protein [Solirubrobacteraceae bacterium]